MKDKILGGKPEVKCPFYRGDDGRGCLACEGVVEDCCMEWKYRKQ